MQDSKRTSLGFSRIQRFLTSSWLSSFGGISLWFQCLWLLAVLGQERWQWWLLALVALTWFGRCRTHRHAWRWGIVVALLGCSLDSVNIFAGLFVFDSPQLPLWLFGLWWAFAWYSWWLLHWLQRFSALLVIPIAAIAGVASYIGGAQLGAVMLPLGYGLTTIVLQCQWGVLIALMIWLRRRYY